MANQSGCRDRGARLVWGGVGLAAGVSILIAASERPSAQQASGTGFPISVDFAAVDERGSPIPDLRPDEVVVRIGRETADVRSLRFLPVVSEGPSAARTRRPPFGLEATDFERNFLVVVDDESLPQGSEQSTRDALGGFVRRLDPHDLVGLATVPHGGVRAPVAPDRSRVLLAAMRISGRATGRETATDAACRSRNVLRELDSLLSTVDTNGPLIVLFFSGSMYDGGGAIQAPFGSFISCDLQLSDFQQLGVRAARSRAYVYIVQPETFTTPTWTSSPRAGLEHVAGATGGRILQLSGGDTDVLDRVRREMSGLYLARVFLQSQPRPGTIQPVSVRVSRPGVSVIARPQLAIPTGSLPR